MGFGGYTQTSDTFNHKSYAQYNSSSYKWKDKKCWYNFKIEVTVAANGTVSYTITSTNNVSSAMGVTWTHCDVSAWIEINGETVLSTGYYTDSSKFPKKYNSSKSGTLSGKASSGSVSIKTKILPASSYAANNDHTTTFNKSLKESTLTRGSWSWADNTVAKPIITNHGNGKFSISATAGVPGNNNSVTSSTLKYKIGSDGWTTASGLSVSNASLTCGASTASQTIKAKTEVVGTYNSPTASADDVTVENYLAPGLPGTVSLTKTKTRLTVRENWTISWIAANKKNDSCPVAGYRIRMYVKKAGEDSFVTAPIKNSSGNNRTGVGNYYGTDYYCDLGASTTSITIYPDKQPASYNSGERTLKGGDVIKFEIHARAVDGNNTNLWSYSNGQGRWSPEWSIQNAGVMRVRVNTGTAAKPSYSWKEGVVWVKVNKGTAAKPNIQWVEADLVKTRVKTNNSATSPTYGWKDSG